MRRRTDLWRTGLSSRSDVPPQRLVFRLEADARREVGVLPVGAVGAEHGLLGRTHVA